MEWLAMGESKYQRMVVLDGEGINSSTQGFGLSHLAYSVGAMDWAKCKGVSQ
jgi:hypothetical protein